MTKRHPRSPKRDKKVSDDDAFVAGVLEASNWAQKNQQTLVTGGIALVILAAVGWYLVSNSASTRDAALVELERVTTIASSGDAEQGKAELIAYLEDFGGTPYADEARLALATLYLQTDLPTEALGTIDDAAAGPRDPMGPQFLSLEAKAHEAAGALAEAESTYLQLADIAGYEFQRRTALEDAARIRTLREDYQGAAQIWTDLAAELASSDPQKGLYQMRAAEMRARAG